MHYEVDVLCNRKCKFLFHSEHRLIKKTGSWQVNIQQVVKILAAYSKEVI